MAKAKSKKKPTRAPARKTPNRRVPAGPAGKITVKEAMAALEKAGNAQARKTYARHGGPEPMFGVRFSDLATMVRRIGVDHDLAQALWATGNLDARMLAVKVADPRSVSADELNRWTLEGRMPMLVTYVAQLASESPHASALATRWSGSIEEAQVCAAWALIGHMALCDAVMPDAWFEGRLMVIERTIHTAPNGQRDGMNRTLIAIGCRSPGLRKLANAAAKRIGKVEVDHGDTSCKTPDAGAYIEKAWAHSTSKGFESPAAHERSRDPMRTRC